MNLQTRINTIEQALLKKESLLGNIANFELYDLNGQKVDAEILRMPTRVDAGLAKLANGTEKEIAGVATLGDIILDAARIKLNDEVYSDNEIEIPDCLFLRRDNQKSAAEIISSGAK